jgi:hypothetical protein
MNLLKLIKVFNNLKKISIVVVFLIFSNCLAYAREDFEKDKLSDKPLPIKISKIINKGQNLLTDDMIYKNIELVNNDIENSYVLEIDYKIPEDYEDSAGIVLTILTFGTVPYMVTKAGSLDVKIFNSKHILLHRNLKIELLFAYGWIPIFFNSYFPSENIIPVNEGSGLKGAFLYTISERLGARISKILEEQDNN